MSTYVPCIHPDETDNVSFCIHTHTHKQKRGMETKGCSRNKWLHSLCMCVCVSVRGWGPPLAHFATLGFMFITLSMIITFTDVCVWKRERAWCRQWLSPNLVSRFGVPFQRFLSIRPSPPCFTCASAMLAQPWSSSLSLSDPVILLHLNTTPSCTQWHLLSLSFPSQEE